MHEIFRPLLESALTGIKSSLTEGSDEVRQGLFSSAVEAYIKASSMLNFFETGLLLRMATVPFAMNEEYLGGVIGFAQELQAR